MALKHRASSLPALEQQEACDNRSETSQGWSGSQRDSRTPDGDLKEEEEEEEEKETREMSSPEHQVVFDDIDNDLFFKPRLGEGGDVMSNGDGTCNNNSKKSKRHSSTQRVNFKESRSKGGTLTANLMTRFRETIVSGKRGRFESKESVGSDHPDMVEQSRWNCSIL